MKKMRLIVVGLTLSALVGCMTVQSVPQNQTGTDPVIGTTILEKLHILKTQGCSALPELERALLVLLIKSKVAVYPTNGLCDPQWINDVLLHQIKRLESKDGVHNGSALLGHTADRWHRSVDKPDRITLLFPATGSGSCSTCGIPDGSGIDPQVRALVHASRFEVHQGGSGDSRLHLYRSMQADYQGTS